ncbi:hypothetical protein G7Y31_05965 [Corynebacterium lizhenjunii]|uniref:Uncharacterized protein n=1 Tax=Corynebacterium lizhenjunii TaxID=2709394 RepID=A0A7T0KI92_9CORY|nr:hypothetical protein [Corynebacterium lizhenjunii]QPK80208.1 hypothetical protein G7Y31_05965 [Corynebacterium lizhenjunii]
MDMRAEVYSPLQNTAVWLGAWLYGYVSTDDLLDALTELGGRPQGTDGESFSTVLARLRQVTADVLVATSPEPVLRLVLSGPGEPPVLPAGSVSADAAAVNPAGALIVRTSQPDRNVVLIPQATDSGQVWQVIEETQPLPAPAWLSPGDADAALVQATNQAAALIESQVGQVDSATRALGMHGTRLPNPRLTIGTLSDFYDAPGLPPATSPRAAKLFARADRVAAIIETVTDRLGDHSLDPQLLALWRPLRQTRMAGVAHALSEFARGRN